nr:reverse transcriptase domain-containing protein [Tanacetum cinerariifolium]
VLLLQKFDIIVRDKKGAENLAADHLSRLENPHQSVLDTKKINETFPLETLNMVSFRGNSSTPWFAEFVKRGELYCERNAIPKKEQILQRCEALLLGRPLLVQNLCGSSHPMEQVYTCGRRLLVEMGRSESAPHQRRLGFCKFLKSLFARFGTPRAIISDRGTHFCNDQFKKVMLKYGVTHRLATAYHPKTSGQVDVSNCGLKRILERNLGENHASWSDKLDDAL